MHALPAAMPALGRGGGFVLKKNQKLNTHKESLFLPIENQSIEYGLVKQKNEYNNINETIKNTLWFTTQKCRLNWKC